LLNVKTRDGSLLKLLSYNDKSPAKDSHDSYIPTGIESRRIIASEQVHYTKRRNNHLYKQSTSTNKRKRKITHDDIQSRLNKAIEVERKLSQSTEYLQQILSQKNSKLNDNDNHLYDNLLDSLQTSFPTVRDCNGALATLGDTGDFKRALQLFGLMRKSVTLAMTAAQSIQMKNGSKLFLCPPVPTLVTYSTLMSRAVALGKEKVALRLWRLMISSPSFYTNFEKSDCNNKVIGSPIVPDIRAVNILMNVFAKMGDPFNAKRLMEQLHTGEVVAYDASMEKNGRIFLEGMEELELTSVETEDLGLGLIKVIPRIQPNIVTYNTLIDACHRAGDLDGGLDALEYMKLYTNIKPDIFTFTSLISTVARKATVSNGKSDPDLAFELFDEMVNVYRIRPNGMSYCALIDVCGRCRRSDLALKGLRMMLREKRQRKVDAGEMNTMFNMLDNEVGAWTAAIDACGKAGRLDTAIRLFQDMPKFGVKPNIYTCGALTDCLLKSCTQNYLDETLKVLRYMKQEGIEPSEFMYTSLITSAGKFAKKANQARGEIVLTDFGDRTRVGTSKDDDHSEDRLKALDVYTELIRSLTNHNARDNFDKNKRKQKQDSNNVSDELLVKVFLVLQEMKASGTDPDIACYNAVLRACAKAGDVPRLTDVLGRIRRDGLNPNSTTWKELLRGASIARDSSMAEKIWGMALAEIDHNGHECFTDSRWIPSGDEFELLLSSYIKEAGKWPDRKLYLYNQIVEAYIAVAKRDERLGFNHIDIDDIKDKPRSVNMIYQAASYLRSNIHFVKDANLLANLKENLVYVEGDLNLNL
jgi:pentatricopeptide repeat protein